MSLISRKLLTADEVLRIGSPYILVMIPSEAPALSYVPDISKMHFNKLNGMGTKEENQQLRIDREAKRETRKISQIKIWDIWNQYLNQDNRDYDLEHVRHGWRTMQRKVESEIEEGTDKEDS